MFEFQYIHLLRVVSWSMCWSVFGLEVKVGRLSLCMKNYSYKLIERSAFRRVKLMESNNNKSSHMDTLLLSIPPNALETLILESISVDDVLNSEHI